MKNYTSSYWLKIEKEKFNFELVTRRLKFFFNFQVTNWKLKNKKLDL